MHLRARLLAPFSAGGLLAIAMAMLVGCGGDGASSGFTRPNGTDADANTNGGQGSEPPPLTDDEQDTTPKPTRPGGVAEVFAHSDTMLYRLDPETKAITVIGSFRGCTRVIDLALDEDSNLYATTPSQLVRVDPTTAQCTVLQTGTYPNSLSFVPKGTLDPNAEALVGYENADYVRIDPKTGTKRKIGELGNGYRSSGDIVSVKGGATYLTVVGGPESCGDCLVEVNPVTGAVVKNWGPVGKVAVYGLAFWAGSVYGFNDPGELFEIRFDNNRITTTTIPFPNRPQRLSFYGAGSTTSAPLAPPR
jgi:hypothetical protein